MLLYYSQCKIPTVLNSKFGEDYMREALDTIDKDIEDAENELESVNQIEKDFIEFVDFSLGFIEDLRTRFWELDAEHLGWCKQLLFPDGFSVSRDKKVYTPKISEFYRLATNKKDSEESDFSSMVALRRITLNLTLQVYYIS